MEQAIEQAFEPGEFIGWRDMWEFVEDLEVVASRIAALVGGGGAARAAGLYETFIAACHEKVEEIDDSSGAFGTFVGDLFCGWIRARGAAGEDPGETAGTLLSWMDDDPYGFCYELEREAVKAFDRKGRAAFERAVLARLEAAESGSWPHGRAVAILKEIYARRRNVGAYARLCEEKQEDGPSPDDCAALARMCLGRRRPEEALAWVERGLRLRRQERRMERGGGHLDEMRREILSKLGRGDEALDSAWKVYREAPAEHTYAQLMRYVPKAERADWHARAMAAGEGGDLADLIGLLAGTKEWDRLARLVEGAGREELMRVGHHTTEPAARKLERKHPLQAAELRVALGLRIVGAGKSRYYQAALNHLQVARRILLKQGQEGAWETLVKEIRQEHRRKSSFMPGFERIVEGKRGQEPSFLDRARRRWPRKPGRSPGR